MLRITLLFTDSTIVHRESTSRAILIAARPESRALRLAARLWTAKNRDPHPGCRAITVRLGDAMVGRQGWLQSSKLREQYLDSRCKNLEDARSLLYWAVVDGMVRSRLHGRELSETERRDLRNPRRSVDDEGQYALTPDLELSVEDAERVWGGNYIFGTAEGIILQSLPYPSGLSWPDLEARSLPHARSDQQSPVENATLQIEHPGADWIPLARGPFIFRRRQEKGRFLAGTTDDALVELAEASFSDWGPRVLAEWDQSDPPCRLHIDPIDASMCLAFRTNRPSESETWFKLTLYPSSIPKSEESRQSITGLVPYPNRKVVRNCIMGASSVWQRMVEEFRDAVDAGACRIHARWGSPKTPNFTHIPRDIFRRCYIENWGGQMSVGGQAKFDDGTVLYSIFVARAQRGRLGVHDAVREGRFGPEPGTLRRYEDADCKLFPELEQIMIKEQKSRSAAARALAEAGKVAGVGTTESRAKRLAALHKRERDSSR